jgi:hypothetical protein
VVEGNDDQGSEIFWLPKSGGLSFDKKSAVLRFCLVLSFTLNNNWILYHVPPRRSSKRSPMTLLFFFPLYSRLVRSRNTIRTPGGTKSAASQPRPTPQAPLHRICTSPLEGTSASCPHSPLALSQSGSCMQVLSWT